jgi:hypothetical protein
MITLYASQITSMDDMVIDSKPSRPSASRVPRGILDRPGEGSKMATNLERKQVRVLGVWR